MGKKYKRETHPEVAKHFHVLPFPRTLNISTRRITCLECENLIRRGHFGGIYQCKYCPYKTHCEEAAKSHAIPPKQQEFYGTWAYFKPGVLGPHSRLLPRYCIARDCPEMLKEGRQYTEYPYETRAMSFDQLMEKAHDEESDGEQSAEVQRILEHVATIPPSP